MQTITSFPLNNLAPVAIAAQDFQSAELSNCCMPLLLRDGVLDSATCDEYCRLFESKGKLIGFDETKLFINLEWIVLKELILTVPSTQLSVIPKLETINSINSTTTTSCQSVSAASQPVGFVAPSLIQKKQLQDCLTIQNEFAITSTIKQYFYQQHGGHHYAADDLVYKQVLKVHIVTPIAIGKSENRLMLLSPLMDHKDAWQHLYIRNKGLFNKINDNTPKITTPELLSQDQKVNLLQVRGLLFSAMKLIAQIGTALKHLHVEQNIAHNDLKPDNFFANKITDSAGDGDSSEDDDMVSYYLGDFGYSKKTGFANMEAAARFFSMKKHTYLSPEIQSLVLAFDQSSPTASTSKARKIDLTNIEKQGDIFALGISLYQVLFLREPFAYTSCAENDLFYQHLNSKPKKFWQIVNKQLEVYQTMTDIRSLMDLLERMLHCDATQRATIEEVLAHPWVQNIHTYLFSSG